MSIQDLLWKFLNSDLGLLVSGFFLTTLAGGVLTTWYKRESKKHEIRFVRLHEERANAIKTFHDKTIKLTRVFEVLDNYLKGNECAKPLSGEEIYQQIEEFHELAEEYKIYFNKFLSDHIDKIYINFQTSYDIYLGNKDYKDDEELFRIIDIRTDIENILINILRQEFRSLLGVE